jgi:hypothetical protein
MGGGVGGTCLFIAFALGRPRGEHAPFLGAPTSSPAPATANKCSLWQRPTLSPYPAACPLLPLPPKATPACWRQGRSRCTPSAPPAPATTRLPLTTAAPYQTPGGARPGGGGGAVAGLGTAGAVLRRRGAGRGSAVLPAFRAPDASPRIARAPSADTPPQARDQRPGGAGQTFSAAPLLLLSAPSCAIAGPPPPLQARCPPPLPPDPGPGPAGREVHRAVRGRVTGAYQTPGLRALPAVSSQCLSRTRPGSHQPCTLPSHAPSYKRNGHRVIVNRAGGGPCFCEP